MKGSLTRKVSPIRTGRRPQGSEKSKDRSVKRHKTHQERTTKSKTNKLDPGSIRHRNINSKPQQEEPAAPREALLTDVWRVVLIKNVKTFQCSEMISARSSAMNTFIKKADS